MVASITWIQSPINFISYKIFHIGISDKDLFQLRLGVSDTPFIRTFEKN
jgi:hypothetical protein